MHQSPDKKSKVQQQKPAQDTPENGKTQVPPTFQLKADPIQREQPPQGEQTQTPPAQQGPVTTGGPQGSVMSGTPPSLLGPGGMPFLDPATIRQLVQGMNQVQFQLRTPSFLEMSEAEREREMIQRLRARVPLVGSVLPESWVLSMWQIDPRSTTETREGPERTYNLLSGPQLDEQMMINRIMRRDHPDPLGWRPRLSEHGVGATHLWQDGSEFTFGARPTSDGGSVGLEYRW